MAIALRSRINWGPNKQGVGIMEGGFTESCHRSFIHDFFSSTTVSIFLQVFL